MSASVARGARGAIEGGGAEFRSAETLIVDTVVASSNIWFADRVLL